MIIEMETMHRHWDRDAQRISSGCAGVSRVGKVGLGETDRDRERKRQTEMKDFETEEDTDGGRDRANGS